MLKCSTRQTQGPSSILEAGLAWVPAAATEPMTSACGRTSAFTFLAEKHLLQAIELSGLESVFTQLVAEDIERFRKLWLHIDASYAR